MTHTDRRPLMRRLAVWVVWAGTLAIPAHAISTQAAAAKGQPALSFPVACAVGTDCWILQYTDHDAGPGWADYACGRRSYDGHAGTDIFIGHAGRIAAGIPVVAVADGVVATVRDGMVDQAVTGKPDPALDRVACGNHVTIDHGGGWVSRTCHMRQGSVAVKPGDTVTRGQTIGQVGMSGLAAFPHVEFEVYKDLKPVDPFLGPRADRQPRDTCGLGAAHLWSSAALDAIAYRPADVWRLGFAEGAVDSAPSFAPLSLLRGNTTPAGRFPMTLVSDMLGLRAGDRITVVVDGPQGRITDTKAVQPKDAIASRVVLPLGERLWRAGDYAAEMTIERPDGPTPGRWTRSARISLH